MTPPQTTVRTWARPLLVVCTAYLGLAGGLLYFENQLVFRPTSPDRHWQPVPKGYEKDIEDVELMCADGTAIHAWWCPCADSDQAFLYCHGNGGNLSHRGGSVLKLRELMKASVLIVDYPGYGKSGGSPSEKGCYQAADAGYDWLTKKRGIEPKKLLLYGASLGGGVAVDLATRREHRALVLVKTFTSIPDVACDIYWWLPIPIRPLMSNRFDSIGKIGACKQPVFIAHGTADELIPYAHGQRLFEAAKEPKRFLSLPNAGHNDSLPLEFFTSLQAFLAENPAK